MACECAECTEHGGPNPKYIMFRFLVIIVQITVGFVALVRARSWKVLAVWLGALGTFWTLPRYLICARCEGYGKDCHSLYIGKIVSKYMPRVEGYDRPSNAGIVLEAILLATISNAPPLGMRRQKLALALYLVLASMTFWMHFTHACRHCAEYATDWKKDCPAAKTYRMFFGGGREVAF